MRLDQFGNSLMVVLLLLLSILSCSKPGQEESVQPYRTREAINIEDYQPNFPDTKGYAEFKTSCITCHSLRYIEMQPTFPEKTWEVTVNKMRKNFGAPIPDSTAAKIVSYLVTIKGKK